MGFSDHFFFALSVIPNFHNYFVNFYVPLSAISKIGVQCKQLNHGVQEAGGIFVQEQSIEDKEPRGLMVEARGRLLDGSKRAFTKCKRAFTHQEQEGVYQMQEGV